MFCQQKIKLSHIHSVQNWMSQLFATHGVMSHLVDLFSRWYCRLDIHRSFWTSVVSCVRIKVSRLLQHMEPMITLNKDGALGRRENSRLSL